MSQPSLGFVGGADGPVTVFVSGGGTALLKSTAAVTAVRSKAKGDETALLLITHNMGVVWNTCSRIAVMYAGEIVETGPVKEVFRDPRHPYTQALLDAMPANGRPGEPLAAIPGSVPSPLAFPAGCRFHPRCAFAVPACATAHPELAGAGGHAARCPVWAKDKPAEARIQNSESGS